MNASTPERCEAQCRGVQVGDDRAPIFDCSLEKGHDGWHRSAGLYPTQWTDDSDYAVLSEADEQPDSEARPYEDIRRELGIGVEPVRVGEPAGEYWNVPWRVAQSANADLRAALQVFLSEIRRAADALQGDEYDGDTVISALGYLGSLHPGHAEDDVLDESMLTLRAFLDGALPVPVGDETEALLAAIERLNEQKDRLRRENADLNRLIDTEALSETLARVAGLEAREAALREALEEACDWLADDLPEDPAKDDADDHEARHALREWRYVLADSGEAGS